MWRRCEGHGQATDRLGHMRSRVGVPRGYSLSGGLTSREVSSRDLKVPRRDAISISSLSDET